MKTISKIETIYDENGWDIYFRYVHQRNDLHEGESEEQEEKSEKEENKKDKQPSYSIL